MGTVLITGASGFIGQALCRAMAQDHQVIGLSRKPVDVAGVTPVQADFTSSDDLARLQRYPIDTLIHLAAVTGRGPEPEAMRVNVYGSYQLMRFCIDSGCRKLVLASSIAAVGLQSTAFRPLALPMPDEHPCLDRDGYGVSKYMMEQTAGYLARQNPHLDLIAIRLASIAPEDHTLTPQKAGPLKRQFAIASISWMYLSDAVRCFTMAAEAEARPGLRIMNAVAAQACVADPVPRIISAWYGPDADRMDLSHYQRQGHQRDALFTIDRIRNEIGFVPRRSVPGSP